MMLKVLRNIDRTTLAVYALAFACIPLAFVVYWPFLSDYFVWDDFFFLRAVRNHSFWIVMQRAFIFPEAKPFDEVTLFWRPLIDLYFYVAQVVGLRPEPYHVVNVLVHGMVGGLGAIFIWRLSRSAVSGAVTGLLFSVAPTYDFAVVWIAQVSELVAAAFMLIAMISIRSFLTADKPNRRYAVSAMVFVILALLTKESAVILVVLLPALALAVRGDVRRSRREVLWTLGPPVALCLIFGVAMGVADLLESENSHGLGPHMARNLWRYLKWMVLPYSFGWHPAVREALAAAFLAGGVGAVLRGHRALAFAFIWTIVALAPFTAFDEWIELRYTYLATLPFTAFVVVGCVSAVKSLPLPLARSLAVVGALAVTFALVVTPFRTRDQQAFFAGEAAAYEEMITSVQSLCGGLPSGSHVFVVHGPYGDLFDKHTQPAINLYYDRVNAARVGVLPLSPLIQLIENKCVIQYDSELERYFRTE